MVKLTKNERETLKFLIRDASLSDTSIAESLKITKQAVGAIKRKLFKLGIIEGFNAKVNYSKLGLKVFAVLTLKVKDKGWEILEEDGFRAFKTPNIITCYRIPRGDITNIQVHAFRSIEELDRYTHKLQTKYSEYVEIRDIYIFSHDSISKCSPEALLLKTIDELGIKEAKPWPGLDTD